VYLISIIGRASGNGIAIPSTGTACYTIFTLFSRASFTNSIQFDSGIYDNSEQTFTGAPILGGEFNAGIIRIIIISPSCGIMYSFNIF